MDNNIITRGKLDSTLLYSVLFLVSFGLIMIYSSSYYESITNNSTDKIFLFRQLWWIGLGVMLMTVFSIVNYKYLFSAPLVVIYYLASVGLLIYVLINGSGPSRRWFAITDELRFQPSELSKLLLAIVFTSMFFYLKDHIHKKWVQQITFLVAYVPIALIAKKDLSTGLVVLAIFLVVFIVSVKNPFVILALNSLFGGAVLYFVFLLEPYRLERVQLWINGPFSDPDGKGHQIIQSMYAIGSGDFFGVGLGNSVQKLGVLPLPYNDAIFAIICEELGLFGAFLILLFFVVIIFRLFDLAMITKRTVPKIFFAALMIQISVQVVIHISAITNLLPATGIPLPFISYGGSSLVFLLVELGIALNMSRNIYNDLEKEYGDD